MAAIRSITTDELDAVRLRLGRPLHAKYIMPNPTQFSVLSVYNASSLGLIEPASNRTPKGVCVLFQIRPNACGHSIKSNVALSFPSDLLLFLFVFFPDKERERGGGRELRPNL